MINFFVYVPETGQIVSSGMCMARDISLQQDPRGLVVQGVADFRTQYYDTTTSTVVTRPDQPTPHHVWDWPTKQWLPNLEGALLGRKHDIDVERDRRSVMPIMYQSAPFDADALARERISGTLARLLRGDGLPSGWVGWRDADNQMHWVADPASSVQASLAGLSVAIEDREQALLIAAWTHKHNISQLTTVEGVLAYDLDTGWPT